MRCGLDRGGGSGWSVGDRLGGSRRRSAGFGSGSSGLGLGLSHEVSVSLGPGWQRVCVLQTLFTMHTTKPFSSML
jgi:hypothetical protein